MARIVINLRAVSEFRMQRLLNRDSEALRMISRNPASVRPKPASSPGGLTRAIFFRRESTARACRGPIGLFGRSPREPAVKSRYRSGVKEHASATRLPVSSVVETLMRPVTDGRRRITRPELLAIRGGGQEAMRTQVRPYVRQRPDQPTAGSTLRPKSRNEADH